MLFAACQPSSQNETTNERATLKFCEIESIRIRQGLLRADEFEECEQWGWQNNLYNELQNKIHPLTLDFILEAYFLRKTKYII